MHVVERFRIADGGKKLDIAFTADDPRAFYQPWGAIRPRFLVRGDIMGEGDDCAANNDVKFGEGFDVVPTAAKPDF